MEVAFVELIGSVGFPIACVIALGLFIVKIYNQSVTRENELRSEIKENQKINGKFAEIIAQYEIKLDEIKADVKDIKDTLHIANEN
jgi:F0F1-type ATP synthase membrane subunit b/b'